MATTITFRRGSGFPTSGSGITLAEPVFSTNLSTFHIGLGTGITAAWVGAPITGLCADIAAGITYKLPTAEAIKNYVTEVAGSGVRLSDPNTWTALNTFSAGVSAYGFTADGSVSFNKTIGSVSAYNGIYAKNTVTGEADYLEFNRRPRFVDLSLEDPPISSIIKSPASNLYVFSPSSSIVADSTNGVMFGSDTRRYVFQAYASTDDGVAAAGPAVAKLILESQNPLDDVWEGSIQPAAYLSANRTWTLPDATGTVVLNSTSNAFTGTNSFSSVTTMTGGLSASGGLTFNGLAVFRSGISAAGGITFGATAAFSNSAVFANAEYIRNTTNGQLDLMPAPAGSTAFGIYFDMTSWSYGVVMGTVRTSDMAKNTGGYFRFDVPLTINSNTLFQIGSDGHYRFQRTTTGNDTAQFGAYCDGVNNSGAYAIVGYGAEGNANRSPATLHSNPNLYIYANGTASANDFVRFDHDRTNANIVSGGTSGIFVQPGNGIVGVSGGVSADAFMLAGGGIRTLTGTTYTFLATDNGKVITMNNASGITATVPSGLPVGYSVTVIQLGAGQVGFTAASGVTLNSYTSLRKIAGQHGSASVVSYSTNVFNLAGNLA